MNMQLEQRQQRCFNYIRYISILLPTKVLFIFRCRGYILCFVVVGERDVTSSPITELNCVTHVIITEQNNFLQITRYIFFPACLTHILPVQFKSIVPVEKLSTYITRWCPTLFSYHSSLSNCIGTWLQDIVLSWKFGNKWQYGCDKKMTNILIAEHENESVWYFFRF